MFRDTKKASEGLRFVVSEYEDYRLKLSYDEENCPMICLYRVRHKNAHNEAFTWVKHIDITDVLEQVADYAESQEATA